MGTWSSIYNNSVWSMNLHIGTIARLQEQIASGSRVIRTSDDPSDAGRILALRSQASTLGTYTENLNNIISALDMSYASMESYTTTLSRVEALVTQVVSGTSVSSTNFSSVAAEIDTLLNEVVSLSNTKYLDQYLFGGSNATTQPYAVTKTDGQITSVTYQGSRSEMLVPVASGIKYSGQLVGDSLFRSNDRQQPVFLGNTGAAGDTGTSSVQGDVWLAVTHGATTYGGTSGIAAGASSAAGDTILGDSHTLTIDDVAKTIKLDSGQAVTYTGTETDLAVANSYGDLVYVDITGVTSGFQGTLSISASGNLSIDDGASTTAITFAANQAVTDSQTGRVLYVNTGSIARTGLEAVRVPGTYDVFNTLITIRDTLQNNRGMSEEDQIRVLEESLNSLDEVMNRVTCSITALGSRLSGLDSLKERLETLQDSVSDQASVLESADITEVTTGLAMAQTLYEMSLQVTSKILSMSLLDFI